jgi:hypothetical protein
MITGNWLFTKFEKCLPLQLLYVQMHRVFSSNFKLLIINFGWDYGARQLYRI